MKQFLVVLLFVLVMTPLLSIEQIINVSVTDWMTLKTELSISKGQLENINKEVRSLESSLEQARIEQQNSQTSIESSQKKIYDLEKQLAIAVLQRDQSQNTVNSLESRLIELGVSLNNTQFQLDQNEEDHILSIEGLVSKYERRIIVGKILFYTMVAVAVGEGIYILVGTLLSN